jgi:hypothetical protein
MIKEKVMTKAETKTVTIHKSRQDQIFDLSINHSNSSIECSI